MYRLDGDDNLVGDWPQLAHTPETQRLPPRLLADQYLWNSDLPPSRMIPHYWTCRNCLTRCGNDSDPWNAAQYAPDSLDRHDWAAQWASMFVLAAGSAFSSF